MSRYEGHGRALPLVIGLLRKSVDDSHRQVVVMRSLSRSHRHNIRPSRCVGHEGRKQRMAYDCPTSGHVSTLT